MQEVTIGEFHIIANNETVKITRDEKEIEFRPGEAQALTSLIGIVIGMETLSSIPAFVTSSPFKIWFKEDDSLDIGREDNDNTLNVTWNELDTVIKTVHQAVAVSVNDTTLNSPRGRHVSSPIDSGEPYL